MPIASIMLLQQLCCDMTAASVCVMQLSLLCGACSQSLPSRDIIADSIETVMCGQWYDGNISLPGCDKNMPGVVMAMARFNRPSIMVYGGTIKPGCSKIDGRNLVVSMTFESYGKRMDCLLPVQMLHNEARQMLQEEACNTVPAEHLCKSGSAQYDDQAPQQVTGSLHAGMPILALHVAAILVCT